MAEERCSFCGRTKSESKHMVQGVKPGAYICDRCVRVCKDLVEQDIKRKEEENFKKEQEKKKVLPLFSSEPEPPKSA